MGLSSVSMGWGQTYQVLYTFTGGADGAFPFTGLIRDSAGNLYGTTAGEKTGTVFKLSPHGKFKLLQSFAVPEGIYDWPFSALARDSKGNLYGTIYYGGTDNLGMVYKLDKDDNFSALYNFTEPWDYVGGGPLGPPILDAAGNLYGAAGGNGKCNGGGPVCGVIFELSPNGDETVLHGFSRPRNGDYPEAGLVRDTAGNLYGTTMGGGHAGNGIVFKLDSSGNETVLHTFMGKPDGAKPQFGLIQDKVGNLYGVTPEGGKLGCESNLTCGVIFKVDTSGNETILYSFTGGSDGGNPYGPLIMDTAGNLYGVASFGKLSNGDPGFGVIFKLAPSGKETVIYTFTGGSDGLGPTGLVMDSAGNFYGTTAGGGNLNDCIPPGGLGDGCGVVFKLTP